MNRTEFLRQLHIALSKAPKEERESAIAYYNEYFDEAGEEKEQEVLQRLDSPQKIASQIIADAAVKTIGGDAMPTVRRGVSAIWLVVLSIFAAPIALPLAIAAVLCIFGFVITIAAVIFALLVSAVAAFIAGVACFGIGVAGIIVQPLVGIGAVGSGCILIGGALFFGILIVLAARAVFGTLAKALSRLLNRKLKGEI